MRGRGLLLPVNKTKIEEVAVESMVGNELLASSDVKWSYSVLLGRNVSFAVRGTWNLATNSISCMGHGNAANAVYIYSFLPLISTTK